MDGYRIFKPGENDGPGWDNEPPTFQGTPDIDCFADLTGDDLVDGADLGALLAEWGAYP